MPLQGSPAPIAYPVEEPCGGVLRRGLSRILSALPRGGTLPEAEWTRRHRWLLGFLWLSAGATALYSLIDSGHSFVHTAGHFGAVAAFALLATPARVGRTLRSACCSLGLLTASAALVHISDGRIEMHFAFFVFVVVLTLYEDWMPFILAVGYVLLHHGVLGMVDPEAVFNNADAWANPWKWAVIHAGFVAMAGTAAIVAWRLNEDVRATMRDAHRQLHDMAVTDALTGLANRRQLMADLDAALASSGESLLVLLDLNGFKAYNDTFGHLAGDALLVRLGGRFAKAVGSAGRTYRLGGDEFCMIVQPPCPALERSAADALSEVGDGFDVTASFGSVEIPREAANASDALRLADRRMYAHKAARRSSPSCQTTDVLVSALSARLPELVGHVDGVAELAGTVGRELGLATVALERLGLAARLHDIGKVAIPDAILRKRGPLSEQEWDFMRTHTVIAERILSAAPALSDILPIVRSSHESFDGSGYPDGLAGADIPIEARVLLVCDSFDAMTSDRPYRNARSHDEALAELRRCAGSQFDPAVVAAFEAALAKRAREGSPPAPVVSLA
jgi:diguanylate cyclase (GGDEF)-like protein